MTEQTPVGLEPPPVDPAGTFAQPTLAGLVDATTEAGLELKARSQWSYARQRFLHHRLAMGGLVGLVILFGAGIFANYIAPYSFCSPPQRCSARAVNGGSR